MKKVRVLVLTGYGLNCDHETANAFSLAGAEPVRVHINSLIAGEERLEDFQILAFGGGFSWGDDHGAGVIQATRMKNNLGGQLLEFVEKGGLVIAICNGFQAVVNLGLLPGFDNDYTSRSVALTYNDSGNFRDDWVYLAPNEKSPCVFTKGLESFDLPVRHGEGKLYAEDAVIKRLQDNNQVALRYALADGSPANGKFPENPNGAVDDIAGICDPTGRIFGLMPHPEATVHYSNHPQWTRIKEEKKRKGEAMGDAVSPGLQIFINGVNYVRENQ
ncbi:phosphoribosylformylglycinamidine synthase subunit PurQ [Desulfatibacillum aliphaticivorans]|uniref:phosphoribosylformylglycinamidine synthase subunit PurQ n=1 Tax=Desulfatibacillum aliphaticivorans TaxID=218208 RepID=UPI000428F6B8|nr:phosphoribosylformylglycinamidine synthase subunit PurQ [Desulfatibacillum aliphaticivorans]